MAKKSAAAPAVEVDTTPAVYRNAHRHTAICLRLGEEFVEFIPLELVECQIFHLGRKQFLSAYEKMPEYPVKRAAQLYLFDTRNKTTTDEAREALEGIVANPAYNYDASLFKPLPKDPKMTDAITNMANSVTKNSAPPKAAPAKKPAPAPAKKAAAPAAAKKAAAPAKKVAAPAKQPAAKKAAAPAKKAAPTGGRGAPSRYSMDAKITVVVKENPKRAGTKAHAEFELYKKAKTVGAYAEAGGTLGYLNYDADQGFIKVSDK